MMATSAVIILVPHVMFYHVICLATIYRPWIN